MNNLPNNTKPKNFTTSLKKLIKSLFPYKKGITIVFIFSILSTSFTIVGPKVLGNATTELYNGVVRKLNNAGSIDYTKLHTILLTLLSSIFSFMIVPIFSLNVDFVSISTLYFSAISTHLL